MTKIRWSRKEVRLAKEALLNTEGNKTQAAAIVSELTGRTRAACMVRLCKITDTYPALKKKNIRRRQAKMEQTPAIVNEGPLAKTTNKVEFYKDHIRIYL